MSLIITQQPSTLATDVARIKHQSNVVYGQLSNLLTKAGDYVWANDVYTPQEVLAEFGTGAAQLFELSSIAAQMVGLVTGEEVAVMPPGWTYAINDDGSVTLTQPSSSTSSSSSSS